MPGGDAWTPNVTLRADEWRVADPTGKDIAAHRRARDAVEARVVRFLLRHDVEAERLPRAKETAADAERRLME